MIASRDQSVFCRDPDFKLLPIIFKEWHDLINIRKKGLHELTLGLIT